MLRSERFQIQINPQELDQLTRAVSMLVEPGQGQVLAYTVRNIFDRAAKSMTKVPSLYLVGEEVIKSTQGEGLLAHEPIAEIWQVGDKFDIRYNPAAIDPKIMTHEALRSGMRAAKLYDERRN